MTEFITLPLGAHYKTRAEGWLRFAAAVRSAARQIIADLRGPA